MTRIVVRRPVGVGMAVTLAVVSPIALAASGASVPSASPAATGCQGTVYLTLDTGNMSQAERIASILKAQGIKATFFLANEKTPRGDSALDPGWDGFWRARVAEGHAFGSHTFDHVYFKPAAGKNVGGATAGPGLASAAVAQARPQFGEHAGRASNWDGAQVCAEIKRVDARFKSVTGRGLDPIWRAPGGKAPAPVMQAASACGYRHVFWAPAGFLGDELPSDKFPNAQLLERSLQTIRDGDILMAHLGIWSRQDPYGPTLEPLIAGLKQRGLCFATMRDFPATGHAEAGRGN